MNQQSEIEQATRLLSEGKPLECAAICGSILSRAPENAVAAHLLGLALKDSGELQEGERWVRRSIQLEPGRAEFHANLGNLLRRRGKPIKAVAAFESAVALAPEHRSARHNLAVTLLDLHRLELAEAHCRLLIADEPTDPEAWVLLGLILTGRDALAEAESAYRRAIELDPDNRLAFHNLGALLSRMDKPERALEALSRARSLGVDGFELAFNAARAHLDCNEIELAEQEFVRAVTLRPGDAEAQLHLARTRYMRGDPKFARSLAAASAANRDDMELQLLFGNLMWRSGDLAAAEAITQDLLARKGSDPRIRTMLARILLEAGMLQEAEAHATEAATAAPNDSEAADVLVSVLLARGCPADAVGFIEVQRRMHPLSQTWIAWESTAARLLSQDRHRELYDYERLVQVFDLECPAGWSSMGELNRALARVLGDRHRFSNRPLEQTLRNGTQTSRSLLNDPDPAIQAILRAFGAPIEDYRRRVGIDPAHPLSQRNHGAASFTGAWSVRLRRDGFHVNHVHPDGWLSSAYYVDVPAETRSAAHKTGWIKFGEPRYPVPGLTAEHIVQPRAGRLVLFPSYMWHGTTPITGDEQRLTIAFDVRPLNKEPV